MRNRISSVAAGIIGESGLSRVKKRVDEHDIAMITGFRGKLINCVHTDEEGRVLTKAENQERHRQLLAAILSLRYDVTAVDGTYVENFKTPQAESKENTHFVVNVNADPQFVQNMVKLGEFYCQDSVLIKPKGEAAYLFGTNYADFPGYGKKVPQGNFHYGVENMFMSKIRGRPFSAFENFRWCNNSGKYLITKAAAPVLEWLKKHSNTAP